MANRELKAALCCITTSIPPSEGPMVLGLSMLTNRLTI